MKVHLQLEDGLWTCRFRYLSNSSKWHGKVGHGITPEQAYMMFCINNGLHVRAP